MTNSTNCSIDPNDDFPDIDKILRDFLISCALIAGLVAVFTYLLII